jgi:Holliday junction resolvase RusA-like endonuclease
MTWPLEITLAGPPRGKGAGRAAIASGRAHVYQDAKTRRYEAQLRFAAQRAMADMPPTMQPVAVEIVASLEVPASWPQRKRLAALAGHVRPTVKPDCNNFSKALDALNGVVWLDDKQIVEETVRKIYAEAPSLRIWIRPMAPPALANPMPAAASPLPGLFLVGRQR